MVGIFNKIADLVGIGTDYEKGGRSESTKNLLNLSFNSESKKELVPYLYYEEEHGIFINDNESIGFVVEISPLVGIDTAQIKQLESFLLNQMPEGGFMQILTFATRNVEPLINHWHGSKQPLGEVDGFLQKRGEFFKALAADELDSPVRSRSFRVIISISQPGEANNANFQKLGVVKKRFFTLLDAISIQRSEISAKDLLMLTRDILGCHYSNDNYDALKPLNEQVSSFASSLSISEDGIEYNGGEFTTRTLSVDKYPDEIFIGALSGLLGKGTSDSLNLSCEFGFCLTIANDITESKKEMLRAKGLNARKNAESWATRFSGDVGKNSQEWGSVTRALEGGEKFFSLNFQAFVKSRNTDIEEADQTIRSIFSDNGWSVSADKYFHLPSLIGMLPMTAAAGLWESFRYFGQYKTSLVSEALALMPIYSDWMGTQTPGMLLTSRRGQLGYFSLFDSPTNYNMCIVAPSGGGKSVFMQDLLVNEMSQNVKVFILDLGRSFEKITKLIDGDHIVFDFESNISLNPFSNIPLGKAEDDFLEYALRILYLMASPSGRITDLEKSIISEALVDVWSKHKNQTSVTLIAEFLNQKGTVESRNLATMLKPYTKTGIYGKYFEKPATTDFKKLLTVFEFEEIAAKQDLLAVVMQVIAVQIMQMFSGDRSQRFVIAIDEAWHVLEKFAPLLERLVRTVRKYGGSLMITTQAYSDFNVSTEAKVVWDNSYWHVLLPHDTNAINSLRKTNDFDEDLLALLGTIKTLPGFYSEFLLWSPSSRVIERLALDKYSATLYSTNSQVFNKVKELTAQGVSLLNAIEQIVAERGRG